MSDWWTYRLSDFLLFSPRTYYRLIERYNEAVWPAHLVTLTIGCMMLVLLLRPRAGQPRILWLVLGLLWAWIGWAYLWRRYSTINWAAMYIVPFFAIESLLLGWESWGSKPAAVPARGSTASSVGLVLVSASVVVYPAIAVLAGRPWRQAEVFGLSPDPTAIATLGFALFLRSRSRAALLVIPAVWCLFSGLTLWAMGSPETWVPPLAVILALAAVRFSRPINRPPNGRKDRS